MADGLSLRLPSTMPDHFPKRHASFHSPREVPLPSPSRERTQPFFEPEQPDARHQSSWLDRFSSASLPIPSQIPYFTLPKAKNDPEQLVCPPLDESSSESSLDSSNNTSSSSSSDGSMRATPAPAKPGSPPPPQPSRPTSPLPFRAPQPPTSPRLNACVAPTPTAMRPRPLSGFPSLPGYTPASPIPSALSSSFGVLPEAPTILEDPPSSNHDPSNRAPYEAFLGGGVGGTNAQPPPDSWIQIESLMGEYRLYVRLPGFTREGITLATKRRRILHLVADRWDRDGGASFSSPYYYPRTNSREKATLNGEYPLATTPTSCKSGQSLTARC